MPQLTEKDQADLFTRWLKNSRRYFRDPPRYTNIELIGLAAEFLDSTSLITLPDELVSYTRKEWSKKGVATRARRKARKEKEARKKRQLELQL